jgi:hypothetical protein
VTAEIQRLLDDPVASATHIAHPRSGNHRLDEAIAVFFLGDVLVHTWDLARASGLDETLDPEVVHDMLVGMVPLDDAFAGQRSVRPREFRLPPTLNEQTRLIAFTGRQPWTTASPGGSGGGPARGRWSRAPQREVVLLERLAHASGALKQSGRARRMRARSSIRCSAVRGRTNDSNR